MRIIHLGKYYFPACGGIETHVRQLARGQAALGHDVTVVAMNHIAHEGKAVANRVFTTTPTRYDQDGDVRVIRVGRFGSLFKMDFTRSLRPVLRRLAADSVALWHLHTPNPAMLVGLARTNTIRRLVITHHSDIIRQRWGRLALLPLETRVYRRAGKILSDSPTYIGGSTTLTGSLEKTECLPLGIDLQPYLDPSDSALDYARHLRDQHSGPRWLFVGRLIYYKALPVALDALRSVPGTLFVIGSGPLESKLKRLAEELGVADRVVWHGPATGDQLVGAYHAAEALWFPSNARSEGFGLVQVEAMASGCPVINTAIPHSGVPWVSKHMETGITIPINNAIALAEAAHRLLDEPELRTKLGEGGRERAVEEFDYRTMVERSIAIYRKCESVEPTPKHAARNRVEVARK